jgi:hypothetical protein
VNPRQRPFFAQDSSDFGRKDLRDYFYLWPIRCTPNLRRLRAPHLPKATFLANQISTKATWNNEEICVFIKSLNFGRNFQPKPLEIMKKSVFSLSHLTLGEIFNQSHLT